MAKQPVAIDGYQHAFPPQREVPIQDRVEQAFSDVLASQEVRRISFRKWSMKIPEPKFGTLDFRAFPFQKALYTNHVAYADEVVVQKCSQVGASAWLARAAIFWADTRGKTVLYVMPTEQTLAKFSNQRIAELIRRSEYLSLKVPFDNVNNLMQRQIGRGFFNMAGSNSEAALESVDADVLALDEYDLLVQRNVPRAEKRVSGPMSLGLIRRIGFPTLPNFGVNKKYTESDQREWTVRCEGCGEWQTLDFWKNVDQDAMLRVCADCRKPLDVTQGEWIAKHPDRDVPGFLLTRLMVPNASMKNVVSESRRRKPYEIQEFMNRTLGLPFVQEEGRLSDEAIARAQAGYEILTFDHGYGGDRLVTMGIDVASVRNLNVRISEHFDNGSKRALWIGEVENFDDLPKLMHLYKVDMCCIDHLPEGRLARAFQSRFPGKVFLNHFKAEGGVNATTDVFQINPEQGEVTTHRTAACDLVIHQIRTRRNLLPANPPRDWQEHMQSNVRFVDKDEFDRVKVEYRATGDIDYFMAEVYDCVAKECFLFMQAFESLQEESYSTLNDHFEYEETHLETVDDDEQYSPALPEGNWTGDDL